MRAAVAMASVVVGVGLVARDGELAGVHGACIGVSYPEAGSSTG
jgi:hypothetical protein